MTDIKHQTVEPQYQMLLDIKESIGETRLGLMTAQSWHTDPKHLLFTLSRYKFVAKMFEGQARVLEVGCGDGFPGRIVQQSVESLTASDFDPLFLDDAKSRTVAGWEAEYVQHDLLAGPFDQKFDAAYSLDVLEHIDSKDEHAFLTNLCASLESRGELIIGMPSLESQVYASPQSKKGHVNCKKSPELRTLMQRYFDHVFLFSMNDEVVHTGYAPMAHYLMAVCAGKKQDME